MQRFMFRKKPRHPRPSVKFASIRQALAWLAQAVRDCIYEIERQTPRDKLKIVNRRLFVPIGSLTRSLFHSHVRANIIYRVC
jgi:hypothetical protein